MIEHFKAQKLIHRRFAFQILLQVRVICKALRRHFQVMPESCAVYLATLL